MRLRSNMSIMSSDALFVNASGALSFTDVVQLLRMREGKVPGRGAPATSRTFSMQSRLLNSQVVAERRRVSVTPLIFEAFRASIISFESSSLKLSFFAVPVSIKSLLAGVELLEVRHPATEASNKK